MFQLFVFRFHLADLQHYILGLRSLVVHHLQEVLLDLLHVPLVLQLALIQCLFQLLVGLRKALYLALELRDHLDGVLWPGRLHDQVVLVGRKLNLLRVHLRSLWAPAFVPGKLWACARQSRLLSHLPEVLLQVLAELLDVWPPRLNPAEKLVCLLRYRRRDLIPHLVREFSTLSRTTRAMYWR